MPPEYLTNVYVRDKLAPIRLNRYHEDLLFYLFYVNGGDLLQLAAAAELYAFHFFLIPGTLLDVCMTLLLLGV